MMARFFNSLVSVSIALTYPVLLQSYSTTVNAYLTSTKLSSFRTRNSSKLYSDALNNGGEKSSSSSSEKKMKKATKPSCIRFLGKGDRAVVRPGVVLIAPNHEYNHFLMRSAVFIHGVGENEEGELAARGVIIDHPTAFTMGEMGGGSVYGTLAHNVLFQGGDMGNDSAILLHSCGSEGREQGDQSSLTQTVDCGEMIGMSGIYEGGLQSAMDLADEGLVDPENFKFFFNYVEFTDTELTGMLGATDSDGDAWTSVEVAPHIILESDYSRGDAWSYLRNQLKQIVK